MQGKRPLVDVADVGSISASAGGEDQAIVWGRVRVLSIHFERPHGVVTVALAVGPLVMVSRMILDAVQAP